MHVLGLLVTLCYSPRGPAAAIDKLRQGLSLTGDPDDGK